MLKGMVEKVNVLTDGGELLQAAIFFNQNELLKYFISIGCRLDNPPDTVNRVLSDSSNKLDHYRKSPFII